MYKLIDSGLKEYSNINNVIQINKKRRNINKITIKKMK